MTDVAYRAEVVGSLLRPAYLKEAIAGADPDEIARAQDRAVAEQLVAGLHCQRLFLEYDTPRSGTFGPLRLVSPEKTVVLGLVTTKEPALEADDDLRRRIEKAAEYVPLERLALSPQCGFASTLPGNLIGEDAQRRKLEAVGRVAREVWT